MINQSIFQEIIENFETLKDQNGNHLNMDGVIMSQGDLTFEKTFSDPFPQNNVRSIGKAVISLCIGIAIDAGLEIRGEKLSLDTLIWPYFQDKINLTNQNNIEKLGKITLKHLMTHTMGYDRGLLFSREIPVVGEYNLLDYVFNFDLVHEPGEHFVYSNVGPYIISALIQNELKINLMDWADELLFNPLGIKSFEWIKYGDYVAGCTGLTIGLQDLHKIATLLVNDGVYKGNQIVSKNWINQLKSVHVYTPSAYDENSALPRYAYGLFFRLCKENYYFCGGADGQYIIMFPEQKIAITTMGHQRDMDPIGECFRPLLESIFN